MAAVSAGMLIYAASVEMLAGDFIMDPSLWKSGVGRQALALVSLLVGAGAMALIGCVFLTFPAPFRSDGDFGAGYGDRSFVSGHAIRQILYWLFGYERLCIIMIHLYRCCSPTAPLPATTSRLMRS